MLALYKFLNKHKMFVLNKNARPLIMPSNYFLNDFLRENKSKYLKRLRSRPALGTSADALEIVYRADKI